jgi:hypothetical protein
VIIEGTKHGSAAKLAGYLLKGKKGGSVRLVEITGSVTGDLQEALTDWEQCGRLLSKGRRILLHTYIRIRDRETLTADRWREVTEKLETALGLTGCARAVVAHEEGIRGTHLHVVWSRLRPDETLAPLHHDRRQFHAVARWAEEEYGLSPVTSQKTEHRRLKDRDIKALKGRGMTSGHLQKILLKAWNTTTDGNAFRAALDDEDILILKGDRRDYVIDVGGLKMNPVRLLPGVTGAEFRARLEGVDMLRETPAARELRGRRARSMATEQINRHLANDEQNKPPKSGFNRTRRRPAPEIGSG